MMRSTARRQPGAASLALVLALLLPQALGQCAPQCGDCNLDGTFSVLDALVAAQIAVGLFTPTPAHDLACDVQPAGGDGDIDALDTLVLAQVAIGLPVNLGCFPVVVAPEGYGVPVPVLHTEVTVSDPDRLDPNFGCALSTVFFDVRPTPGTPRIVLTVSGMSTPTDFDLFIGATGVPAGDTTASNYTRRSQTVGSGIETYELACSGLDAYGGYIAVAVHAVVAGTFNFQVLGDPGAVCVCGAPTVEAGELRVGRLGAVAGPCPPIPCNFTSTQYELSVIPPGTTSLTLAMQGPPPSANGDYDLWIGYPGVCGGDCFVTNFHGSSRGPGGVWRWGNPLFFETLTLSATEVSEYGTGPLAIGVSVFTGPPGGADFFLDIFTHGCGGLPAASLPGPSPVAGSVSHCRIDRITADVADRWEFNAVAGQSIEVRVDTASDGGAFDPQVELREAGLPARLAAGDDDEPCTFPPPLSGGSECPRLVHVACATSTYEVTILRGVDGLCRDASNGAYILTVLVDGVPAGLTPTCDDC